MLHFFHYFLKDATFLWDMSEKLRWEQGAKNGFERGSSCWLEEIMIPVFSLHQKSSVSKLEFSLIVH